MEKNQSAVVKPIILKKTAMARKKKCPLQKGNSKRQRKKETSEPKGKCIERNSYRGREKEVCG